MIKKAPSDLLRNAIKIAALSGLHAGEIAALTVHDCRDGVLTIRIGKSAATARKVPIHSQLGSIIDKRAKAKSSSEYLLPELSGNAESLVKRFARYRAQLHGQGDGPAKKLSTTFGTIGSMSVSRPVAISIFCSSWLITNFKV